MAVDEALLEGARHSGTAVLRFYGWNPACISLGRLQKVPDVVLSQDTFDWVRRPTGGRAVLHQHEVTYCAVIPESALARENRSVLGAYQWLSQGFITGLEELGVHAELAPAHRGRLADNCFTAPAQCDFVVNGRKLIGAAQCRRHGVILQHGAILMHIDGHSWQTALSSTMEGAVALDELGIRADTETLAAALATGLRRRNNVHFEPSGLSEEENLMASQLHSLKYSQITWNHLGKEPVATSH